MKKLILLVGVWLLASCSATSTMTSAEKTAAVNNYVAVNKLEQVDKISAFHFDRWSPLGRQHVILYRRLNEPFLVKLQHNCMEIHFTHALGVKYTGSTLMAKYDYLVVPGSLHPKCFIDSIHKINKEQKEQLMAIGEPVEESANKTFDSQIDA